MSKDRLNYIEYGAESHKKTVVVLHGLFGSAKNLAGICRHLSAQCRVIAFDLPNHGQSPHVDVMSIQAMAGAIIEEIQVRDLSQVSLLGHSLGGKTAMAIALRDSDLVEKLLVADIAPVTYPPGHNDILEAMLTLPDGLSSRQLADEHLARWVSDMPTRQFLLQNLVKQGESFVWRINVRGIADSYEMLRGGFDTGEYSGVFRKPTLFVKGQNSNYIKDEYLSSISQWFPEYALCEIAGAGHWLHAEKPNEFNKIVADFFL